MILLLFFLMLYFGDWGWDPIHFFYSYFLFDCKISLNLFDYDFYYLN